MANFSFDIFETILRRKQITYERFIESFASREISNVQKRVAFKKERIRASSQSRLCISKQYSLVAEKVPLSEREINRLIKAEFEYELESAVAIVPCVELIKRLHSRGRVIAFISDMHLPEAEVRKILVKVGLADIENIPIFISCEHNATKKEGNLYDIVRFKTGKKSWTHIGDNYQSDFVKARKRGIESIYLPLTAQTKREFEKLDKHLPGLASQIDAWLLRKPISTRRRLPSTRSFLYWVAFFLSFVAVLKTRFTGRELVFFSRDGYFLEKFVRLLAPSLSTRYLPYSRAISRHLDVEAVLGYYKSQIPPNSVLIDVGWSGKSLKKLQQKLCTDSTIFLIQSYDYSINSLIEKRQCRLHQTYWEQILQGPEATVVGYSIDLAAGVEFERGYCESRNQFACAIFEMLSTLQPALPPAAEAEYVARISAKIINRDCELPMAQYLLRNPFLEESSGGCERVQFVKKMNLFEIGRELCSSRVVWIPGSLQLTELPRSVSKMMSLVSVIRDRLLG